MSIVALFAAFTLVGADKAATVVIPENAEPSTRLCVEELTNYVGKVTGVTLQVKVRGAIERSEIAERSVGLREQWSSPSVVIGTLNTLKDVPAAAKEALAKTKQFEAGWMGTADGNLWIIGKEATSDMYLMYHFLETKLGVRWFQAETHEDPGDYYPRQKTIVLEDFAECREPDFYRRRFGQQMCDYDVIPYEGAVWLYRNGYQLNCPIEYWNEPVRKNPAGRGQMKVEEHRAFYEPRFSRRFVKNGGHLTCVRVFSWQQYLKTDPELFALQGGIRGGKKQRTWHYCYTNPKLMDGLVDYYVKFFKDNGGRGVFKFGQTDETHGWCECENCRKLDPPGEDAYGNSVCVSSRMVWFASRLFDRIHEKVPEVDFNYEPYAVYRPLPKRGKMPDYAFCQYSPHGRCYTHRFNDPKCIRNAALWKEMMAWREMLPRGLWTYDYFTCSSIEYCCRELMEAEDIKLYKSLGMIGWYNEGSIPGAKFLERGLPDVKERFPSDWQWVYATGHLLWNADQDVMTLIDDAESKYYGKAYSAMKPYHKLRRDLWANRNECVGYPYGNPMRPLLLNAAGAKEKLLGYLDAADKLAEDDKVLKCRLSRDRHWLTEYWIKPNEKARAKAGDKFSIPKASAPVTIDGDGSDPAWLSALWIDNGRFRKQVLDPKGAKGVPAEYATDVGIVQDGDSLCFLVKAAEPEPDKIKLTCTKHDEPVWGDDCVELALFPPAIENCYYHIAVNPNGAVYDARCPGNDPAWDLGVTAKGKRAEKGWTLEIRVPSAKLYPLVAGDKWRLQIGRNRNAPGEWNSFSLGGYQLHDTAEFVTVELGSSLLPNGGFLEVDAKNKPQGWLVNDGEVRQENGKNVLFTRGFTRAPEFRYGPLGKNVHPRKIAWSFKAKGKGSLVCAFVRYDDAKKEGVWMPQPWGKGCTAELTDNWKIYAGTYEIKEGEVVALAFTPPKEGCLISDANVTKIDK